jgi:hypothetical protein
MYGQLAQMDGDHHLKRQVWSRLLCEGSPGWLPGGLTDEGRVVLPDDGG